MDWKEDIEVKFFIPAGSLGIITEAKIADTNIRNNKPKHEKVVRALWDTGATVSTISRNLAEELHLEMMGAQTYQAYEGIGVAKTVLALSFPGNSKWCALVEAQEMGSREGDFDFIIGMDIIGLGMTWLHPDPDGGMHMSFRFNPERFINLEKDEPAVTIGKMQWFTKRMSDIRLGKAGVF